jgi:nucleoside-diphosphate-sugar epimerase
MGVNLITGGFGFIGCYLARQLIKQDEQVVISDVTSGAKLLDHLKGKYQAFRCDLTDWPGLFEVIKTNRVDAIYHLGSLLPPQSEAHLWPSYQVNVTGTVNVLEAARLLGVGSVVYASSIGSYGLSAPKVINEDVVQFPTSIYGATKVCCERLGEQCFRKDGLNFRGVRFPPIMGPGRSGRQPSSYTCQMIEEPALGRPYTALVPPDTRIASLYVKDAVQGLIGLKQAREEKLKRRMYNLHGLAPSAGQMAEAVARHIPQAGIAFKPVPGAADFARLWPDRLDDSRAREEWGWQPHYDLDAIIEDFIQEIKEHPAIF